MNSKEISKSIFDRAKRFYVFNEDEYRNLNEAAAFLFSSLEKVLDEFECDVAFNSDGFDIQKLLKFYNFSVDIQSNDWYNKLMGIISVYGDLYPNKILCFVNLKQWMNEEETEKIYKQITSQKVTTLLLESVECPATYKYEKKLVVDNDFFEFVC